MRSSPACPFRIGRSQYFMARHFLFAFFQFISLMPALSWVGVCYQIPGMILWIKPFFCNIDQFSGDRGRELISQESLFLKRERSTEKGRRSKRKRSYCCCMQCTWYIKSWCILLLCGLAWVVGSDPPQKLTVFTRRRVILYVAGCCRASENIYLAAGVQKTDDNKSRSPKLDTLNSPRATSRPVKHRSTYLVISSRSPTIFTGLARHEAG